MAEGHRLRRLEMREARHDGGGVLFRADEEGLDQALQRRGDAKTLVLDPEPEIDRHLVVARAGRVQPAGRRADQFGKTRFDIHVDVFQARREFELAVFDLFQNRVQAVSDLFLIGRGDNALCGEHLGMGDGAANVLPVEFLVETDRGVDRFHDGGRA